MCSAIGGSLFGFLVARFKVEIFMRYVFLVCAAAMITPLFTGDHFLIMSAFAVFEVCVGIFWPGMGCMRSKYVPEEGRTTIMSLFRVPLNFLVCLILLYLGKYPPSVCFGLCSVFFLVCTCLQTLLTIVVEREMMEA